MIILLACLLGSLSYSVQDDYPVLSEILAEVESKYHQNVFYDPETKLTIDYNLFLPDNYTSSKQYPLLAWIPDASTVGRGTLAALEQGYGGVIWATEYEQKKREAIIVVPTYNTTIIDDNNGYTATLYIEATKHLIENIAALYSVDLDRIYCTGQSMGCMSFLFLASKYPDFFAAELFVSGQWRIDELEGLKSNTFFYVVAGGDSKASAGQEEVYTYLTANNIPLTRVKDLDARMKNPEWVPVIDDIVANGTKINMFNFVTGSVLDNSAASQKKNPPSGNEHMASFDKAYRIEALRDWLFAQRRGNNKNKTN